MLAGLLHWQSLLIGLSLTIMASRSAFLPHQLLAEKDFFFFELDIVWCIMCSRIRIPWPKVLILVSFFSGEDTPSTDTSRYIPQLPKVCRSVFWGATLYIYFNVHCKSAHHGCPSKGELSLNMLLFHEGQFWLGAMWVQMHIRGCEYFLLLLSSQC